MSSMNTYPIPTHLKDIWVVNEQKSNEDNVEGFVKCTCGSLRFRIQHNLEQDEDHIWKRPYDETIPFSENPGVKVTAECLECSKIYVLLDEATQGYNGYVCHELKSADEESLKEYQCEECNQNDFVSYIEIETEDYEQFVDECEEFKPEEYVDAFNSIVIRIVCNNCKKQMNLVILELS